MFLTPELTLHSNKEPTLKRPAFDTLYSGQFTLSTQLINKIILIHPQSTEHHSSLEVYPLCSWYRLCTSLRCFPTWFCSSFLCEVLLWRELAMESCSIWSLSSPDSRIQRWEFVVIVWSYEVPVYSVDRHCLILCSAVLREKIWSFRADKDHNGNASHD